MGILSMFRRKLGACLLSLLATHVVSASESILVVTSEQTPIDSLNRQQVKNVYLGAPLEFESVKLVLPPSSDLRQKFNTRVIGLSESRLRSYFAQMRFSGRQIAMTEVGSAEEIIEFVANTPGSIGYVSSNTSIPDNVKVIFQLEL